MCHNDFENMLGFFVMEDEQSEEIMSDEDEKTEEENKEK